MTARTSKPAAARPRVPALVELNRRPAPEKVEKIALFSIDGTDYMMPAVVEVTDAIQWLPRVNRFDDENVKGLFLLQLLCGDDAGDALLRDATMTTAEWAKLRKVMTEHAFGQLEKSGN